MACGAEVAPGRARLPHRDYCLKEDARPEQWLQACLAPAEKTFELLRDPPETAPAKAATTMRINGLALENGLPGLAAHSHDQLFAVRAIQWAAVDQR